MLIGPKLATNVNIKWKSFVLFCFIGAHTEFLLLQYILVILQTDSLCNMLYGRHSSANQTLKQLVIISDIKSQFL